MPFEVLIFYREECMTGDPLEDLGGGVVENIKAERGRYRFASV